MNNDNKYFVVKNKNNSEIAYFEYDKIDGLDITPKKNVKFIDSINVNRIIVVNPSFINKIVSHKIQKKFIALINSLNHFYDDDNDETSGDYLLALNEVSKFRQEIMNKYHAYLSAEELAILLKKTKIIETELKLRRTNIYTPDENTLGHGK